jgi:hypothetical protein
LADADLGRHAFNEFWVPRSHERADLVVIGLSMDAFEIKTERDTLRRLPRQAAAYARLFDRCTVVVAERHAAGARLLLPEWWGITTIHTSGDVAFTALREPRANPNVDPEILVRLLWRDEAMAALFHLGQKPDERLPRPSLWRQLLRATTPGQLRDIVCRAVLGRDPGSARIATRRFTPPLRAAVESGR